MIVPRYIDADKLREDAYTVTTPAGDLDVIELKDLEQAPTADVAPVVRGEWVDDTQDFNTEQWWKCTACGESVVLPLDAENGPLSWGYIGCPHCFADMRKEANPT